MRIADRIESLSMDPRPCHSRKQIGVERLYLVALVMMLFQWQCALMLTYPFITDWSGLFL